MLIRPMCSVASGCHAVPEDSRSIGKEPSAPVISISWPACPPIGIFICPICPCPICAWSIGIEPLDWGCAGMGICMPGIAPCSAGMFMPGIGCAAWGAEGAALCGIGMVMPGIGFAAAFFLAGTAFFFTVAFFLTGAFFFADDFFFSGIGMCIPGMVICAVAGAEIRATPSALARKLREWRIGLAVGAAEDVN